MKAILKYDLENRRQAITQLKALDDPVRAFEMFFDGLVAGSLADEERKGCFLINTALELPHHDEETRAVVTGGLRDLETFFQQGIEAAQARHEIAATLDPESTAKALVALVVGLRVSARGTFDEAGLQAIKAQAMGLLIPHTAE